MKYTTDTSFMDSWKETALTDEEAPLLLEADVVVCGGGPAGVAAATVCARQGLSTVLVEKNGFCGGAAVAGLSGTICGLYQAQEEIEAKEPKQLVFGFAGEFKIRLAERGGVTEPQIYGSTHVVTFDPFVWREVADDLLEEAGVRCLYHTLVTAVTRKGDRLTSVQLESSAGRTHVKAGAFIDCTGDAAVMTKAGCAYTFGDNGAIQNPTMMFRLSHVEEAGYYDCFGRNTICPESLTRKLTEAFEKGTYDTPRNHIWVFPTPTRSVFLMNCTQLAGQGGEMLNVINPGDRTHAEISGRRAVREYHRFFKENVSGFEDSELMDVPPEVGVRQTRSIKGTVTLTNAHVAQCTKAADGIVRSSWPIELHAGEVSKLHWLIDDYYEVPYGTLVHPELDNVIVAGRSLSAEHEALASARVTAQCFEYGHAAAVATALRLEAGTGYKDVDTDELRRRMVENGSAL
ncbi:FAD-dependent oxidoreductase [Desulfoluna butyratoxydans]|uniref:Fad/nad(P)-binding domain n=1 Tax=Desulfoluna butyratoxydans TaxID=231438 RepID=A0A4U8YS93_9BACT|nr:FAD-dependent oxidoreductase [Desulfoluna butyratoxydans]VFQ46209.1 fad/nad(p)-binding domain [Desulfoluna butyratoxydans]